MLDRLTQLLGMHDGPRPAKEFWDRVPPPKPGNIKIVEQAIEQNGFWEEFVEWRIFTTTHSRIEPVEVRGERWFRVVVKCDHEFSCLCPTIARAVEFAMIYKLLICDMFYFRGWASWATPTQMKPPGR